LSNDFRDSFVLFFFSRIVQASVGTYDVLDTMIKSPSSCLSVKETSLNTVHSSSSLQSVDDRKLLTNSSSALDPSAPIFIPRQSQQKSDDDNDSVWILFSFKSLI